MDERSVELRRELTDRLTESHRRLDELNHDAARRGEMAHTYTPIPVFEQRVRSDDAARILAEERTDARLKALERWQASNAARMTGVVTVVGLLSGGLGAALLKVFGG